MGLLTKRVVTKTKSESIQISHIFFKRIARLFLKKMQTYWKSWGDMTDEEFWRHEWDIHGTCVSTLDTSCYANNKHAQDAVDYFAAAVRVFETLTSYSWLADDDIVPSKNSNYTRSAIEDAVKKRNLGQPAVVRCNGRNELKELWYFFNVRGSVQTGSFLPIHPVYGPGFKESCRPTDILYLPKQATPSR
jgi:ribonuclease T2